MESDHTDSPGWILIAYPFPGYGGFPEFHGPYSQDEAIAIAASKMIGGPPFAYAVRPLGGRPE